MTVISHLWPVLPIVIPWLAAFSTALVAVVLPRSARTAIIVGGVAAVTATLHTAGLGFEQTLVTVVGGWPAAIGIPLIIDPTAAAFLFLNAIGAGLFLTAMIARPAPYSAIPSGASSQTAVGLVAPELPADHAATRTPWRFHVLFFLMFGAMNGAVSTGDLFNLYVFVEVLSITAYVLVAAPRSPAAYGAGLRYLVFGTIGGLFLLVGIMGLYLATGTLTIARLGTALAALPPATITVIRGCLLIGLLIKVGAAPFHFWLPPAHAAAGAPVSALLSGFLLKVFVYALLRVGTVIMADQDSFFWVLTVVGCGSIVVGQLAALHQDDVKRLLACSTVAHIGCILVGIGSRTLPGCAGALLHVANHAVLKAGMFLAAGAMAQAAGSRSVAAWAGIARAAPQASFAFFALAAASCGLPPFGGFWSKWLLIGGAVTAGQWVPALVIALGSVVAVGNYLRVARVACANPASPVPIGHPRPEIASDDAGRASGISERLALTLTLWSIGLGLLTMLPPVWNAVLTLGAQTLAGGGSAAAPGAGG